MALELIVIAAWVLIVAHGYLNLNPRAIPTGDEFGAQTQANHLWTQFPKCGWCAVWNGFEQGGIPAFVDVHGSELHPLVILATLVFGVVNGAKITILISLWLAGVAQWWIAKQFELSAVPRLWAAGIAVAGGHLASKMQHGTYHFIVSIAMASLVLGGVLLLARKGGRRATILLGVLIASALLSGQGYLQIALLGLTPSLLVLMLRGRIAALKILKDFGLAASIGLLLAAPLLVPVAHFLPHFAKLADPDFRTAEPFAYLPLNLVIGDLGFYTTEVLGKASAPDLYALFVGWIPIILALVGLSRVRKEHRWLAWLMVVQIGLLFFLASGILLKALIHTWPSLAQVRYPSIMAALAVPLVLGFSAYGLDDLLQLAKSWPQLVFDLGSSSPGRTLQLPLLWIWAIPLVYGLGSVYAFSQHWYQTRTLDDRVFQTVAALRTDSLQWVNPPAGVFDFIEPAISIGLKLSPGFQDVRWSDRTPPVPVVYGSFTNDTTGSATLLAHIDQFANIYSVPGEYASVVDSAGSTPCAAQGSGGDITVTCSASSDGKLVVLENTWNGWYAWRDGAPVPLRGSSWLEVDAPGGTHTYAFRYLPWDVPVGLGFFLAGVVLVAWLWKGRSAPALSGGREARAADPPGGSRDRQGKRSSRGQRRL